MEENPKIGIIHLIWIPLGFNTYKKFIDSYNSYPINIEHDLVLLFNGTTNEIDIKLYCDYTTELKIPFIKYWIPAGQDIDCYFWIAQQVNYNYLFFINSYSVIQSEQWLEKYYYNLNKATGVISATASNQSHYSSVFQDYKWKYEPKKGWGYNFSKYKLFLKAFFYWQLLFKPFPNPHIRTNAFLIRRDVMLSLKKPVIKNKMDAYAFESGRNSLTIQLLKKGLKTLVIDKHGNSYDLPDWYLSKVFWMANQENLIISDNQTLAYDNASVQQKKIMTKIAWGINE